MLYPEDAIRACAHQYDVGGICNRQTNGLDAIVSKSNCGDHVTTDVDHDDAYESVMVLMLYCYTTVPG